MRQALVVLADGTFFEGESFGHPELAIGEVVFNTSMSGYQEILTDPSYRGQLVTMTAPHIGNYGVNELDRESEHVQVAGLIVRDASRHASNYRATDTLDGYLRAHQKIGITGIDTRALTLRIRDAGAVMGAIAPDASAADVPAIVEAIRRAPGYEELDYVALCSTPVPVRIRIEPTGDRYQPWTVLRMPIDTAWTAEELARPLVAVVDYGIKNSILRSLVASGLRVELLPHDTAPSEILNRGAAGIMLSNGPGDPGRMDAAVARIHEVLGQLPLFGICLGHQLLARAVGGETFKLVFGHRGPNQPVRDEKTGRVQITAQNHGYAVRMEGMRVPGHVTHTNLNDGTVEGIELPSLRAFSVQHHPEAGPGPHDALPMFQTFREAVVAE